MNGWTATGTRPKFSLVSGVSTGALIAPFAFLGPAYDPILTEIYTSGVAENLVKDPSVVNVLFGSGLFGDDRLRDLVGRYVTPDLLTAVAIEHAKGRRLLVVTTNLDAKRAMIWNMGAIAASGAPNALALFRTCSPPPPAYRPYSPRSSSTSGGEPKLPRTSCRRLGDDAGLHGAAGFHGGGWASRRGFAQVRHLRADERQGRARVRIGRQRLLSIVEQTVATGSQARSRASLAATYAFSQAHRIGFHLTYIDEGAPRTSTARGFDTAHMRSLYQAGYDKARAGSAWRGDVPVSPLASKVIASAN